MLPEKSNTIWYCSGTQIHSRFTGTQIHRRFTGTQIHRYTDTQVLQIVHYIVGLSKQLVQQVSEVISLIISPPQLPPPPTVTDTELCRHENRNPSSKKEEKN